jgi:ADP-ribosyl-[dinitrogen reductase] hydrolase
LERNGFDPHDQMERYCRWWAEGYLSSTGVCFDIGNTVRNALHHYRTTKEPYSGSTHPRSAGNGSIMRLAPVPMYYVEDLGKVAHFSGESSRTTHGAQEAVDACRLFGVMVAQALQGESKESILFNQPPALSKGPLAPAIQEIAAGSYRTKQAKEIRGSGYVVESLEAALWCFFNTDNYRNAILMAANLGDDADTTAAVCGQIAGAYYGVEGIPEDWLAKLAMRAYIEDVAGQLFDKRYSFHVL